MNNDIVWFIVVGRNVLSLDEVKRSFESGECDLANMSIAMALKISAALDVDIYALIADTNE